MVGIVLKFGGGLFGQQTIAGIASIGYQAVSIDHECWICEMCGQSAQEANRAWRHARFRDRVTTRSEQRAVLRRPAERDDMPRSTPHD